MIRHKRRDAIGERHSPLAIRQSSWQAIGALKMGPAWTKVWNSPFSPVVGSKRGWLVHI
jgi:hypothetical protein